MSNIDIIMGVNVKGTIIDVINGEKYRRYNFTD